jgi:hypothetical protein
MKAIGIGLGVGLLAVLALISASPDADATCEGCDPGWGGFANLAADLNVNNNTERKFEDTGDFVWCIIDAEPTSGAVEFEETESEDVNNVEVFPAFLNPEGCAGSFEVGVEGFLDQFDEVGTCVISGFVWPPYRNDTHTFTVHELP